MTDLENLKKVIVNALEWSPPKGVARIVHLDLVEETRLFYQAVRQCGLEFTMMQIAFFQNGHENN